MARILLIAGVMVLSGAAGAQPSTTCDIVAKAMMRVSEQPAVHQQTIDGTPPAIQTEAISTPDAMYLREGGSGPWRRMPIDQAARRTLAQKGFEIAPLGDCSGPVAGLDGSEPIQAYRFRQPDLVKPGAFTTSTLWIGADGLPRRLILSPTGHQTMKYGDIAAPTDLAPVRVPRQKPAR